MSSHSDHKIRYFIASPKPKLYRAEYIRKNCAPAPFFSSDYSRNKSNQPLLISSTFGFARETCPITRTRTKPLEMHLFRKEKHL